MAEYDTLEGMPRDLSDCWHYAPKHIKDQLTQYVYSHYNPECYRGSLMLLSRLDEANTQRRPYIILLIDVLREGRDSGLHAELHKYATEPSRTALAYYALLNRTFYSVYRGMFYLFGVSTKEWYAKTKPWVYEALRDMKQ